MKIVLALVFVFLGISGNARAESVSVTAHMTFADAAGARFEVVANTLSLVERLSFSSKVDTAIAGNVRIFGIPDQVAYLYRSCASGVICDDTYLVGNRDRRIALHVGKLSDADSHTAGVTSDYQAVSKRTYSDGIVIVYL